MKQKAVGAVGMEHEKVLESFGRFLPGSQVTVVYRGEFAGPYKTGSATLQMTRSRTSEHGECSASVKYDVSKKEAFTKKEVHINGIFLAEDTKGKDQGTIFATNIVQGCIDNGVQTLSFEAAGFGQDKEKKMNGYYTWLRMGADAQLDQRLRDNLKFIGMPGADNPEIKTLRQAVDSNGEKGWALWMEHGQQWEASLDLSDKKTMAIFYAYADRKLQKAKEKGAQANATS
jgi:hypothetical protein